MPTSTKLDKSAALDVLSLAGVDPQGRLEQLGRRQEDPLSADQIAKVLHELVDASALGRLYRALADALVEAPKPKKVKA